MINNTEEIFNNSTEDLITSDTNIYKKIHEIGLEEIRKNWTKYSKEFVELNKLNIKNILWEDLVKKFDIDPNDIYFITLKKFANGEELVINETVKQPNIIYQNDSTLEIKGLDGYERKTLHNLCDNIGLHHESKQTGKKKKSLFIYKPDEWLWEFSKPNPFSESKEYYQNKEVEWKNKMKKLENITCDICDINCLEADLFRSVYFKGLYCEECLDYESDGQGGKLSDHKFEPCY
jgi:hypothetical protein